VRAVLRFIASVLITSGVLLLLDAGVTLAWQEPVSALIAWRQQAGLQRELDATTRALTPYERALADLELRRRLAALAVRERRRVREGHALGRIELPSLARSYVIVEGTSKPSLRKGPGHYADTPLPGERGTVGIAGHRTTYLAPFRTVDKLKGGDPIVLAMPYGRFTYSVERTRIVRPTATWVKRRVGYDRLVLSACHPLYSAARRIVVFARLILEQPA
jgi:sortase A